MKYALLSSGETEIVGNWVVTDSEVEVDENCLRIEFLVKEKLEKIRVDSTGWDTLYFDPSDGRYWELIYRRGEMHGGGPPSLFLLSKTEAEAKYPELV